MWAVVTVGDEVPTNVTLHLTEEEADRAAAADGPPTYDTFVVDAGDPPATPTKIDRYDKFRQWHHDNVPNSDTDRETMVGLIHFVCCQEAATIKEEWSVQDIAEFLKKQAPINTPKKVDKWLQEQYDGADDEAAVTLDLIARLRKHFGLDE